MDAVDSQRRQAAIAREALRAGTIAGLAMIPFAAMFRALGLRINEYGQKTLALIVTDPPPPLHYSLTLVQHLLISWVVAMPFLVFLVRAHSRTGRSLAGAVYGVVFYVVVNSLALPLAFGDQTPWTLGFDFVYPSLVVHLVYGMVLAMVARGAAPDTLAPIVREGVH
jgi:uncharacterized membrane protein YagU involved in acid resistance